MRIRLLFSSPDVYVWGGDATIPFFSLAPLGAEPIVPPLKGLKEKKNAVGRFFIPGVKRLG
jgi:hypothetical protein